MRLAGYETTRKHALQGVGVAFIIAAGASAVFACVDILSLDQDQPQTLAEFVPFFLSITVVATLACAAVLVATSLIWVLFHQVGLRAWPLAGALGYATSTALLLALRLPAPGVAMLSLGGAILCLVAWRVAYRPTQR